MKFGIISDTHGYLGPILLVAIVGAAYLGTLACGFVADDYARIVEDENIRQWSTALRFFDPFFWRQEAATSGVAYRPVRPCLSALDYTLWGLDSRGFHLTNNVLHIAVVLLVFGFVRGMGASPRAAFLAAAVFGLHAANVEAVAWVKNRTIPSAAAFLLLTLVAGGLRGRWMLASAAFALAVLSHEQAAAGALWAVALLATRQTSQTVGRTWPLWGVLVVYFGARALATVELASTPFVAAQGASLGLVARTVGTYAYTCALPIGLNLERPLMGLCGVAAGLLVIAIVLCVVWRRGKTEAAFCWGFLLLLAPVSNVVQVNPSFGRLIAEQRLYLPLVPLCALAVGALRGRANHALLLALVVVSGSRVIHRTLDWQSSRTIYADAVAKVPADFKARYNLADAFADEARDEAAVREYERSLVLRPSHGGTRCRYAQALHRLGRTHEAVEQLQRVLQRDPPSGAAPLATRLLQAISGARPREHPPH